MRLYRALCITPCVQIPNACPPVCMAAAGGGGDRVETLAPTQTRVSVSLPVSRLRWFSFYLFVPFPLYLSLGRQCESLVPTCTLGRFCLSHKRRVESLVPPGSTRWRDSLSDSLYPRHNVWSMTWRAFPQTR